MITLKRIIEIFQDFANNHAQINSFGVGSYFKIDTMTDRKYPLVWITPKPSTSKTSEHRYQFDIMIADILDGEERNLIDVWSDTNQIARDFIRYYNTTYGNTSTDELYDCRLDDTFYLEPFMHLLDNEAAGYFLRVTFITPEDTSYCILPSKN